MIGSLGGIDMLQYYFCTKLGHNFFLLFPNDYVILSQLLICNKIVIFTFVSGFMHNILISTTQLMAIWAIS